MSTILSTSPVKSKITGWQKIVAQYHKPDVREGFQQIALTFIPYVAFWVVMYWSLSVSYWLTLLLSIPGSLFMVRLFIIMHDCGHGAFFKSQKLNDIVGIITGVLTFTPYYSWRHGHAIHHATSGDLDRRGIGDIQTLTLNEYNALPWYRRLGYRIYRHPIIIFLIGAQINFIILQRFTYREDPKRENLSVHATTAAILGLAALISALIGWQAYLLIQLPMMYLASLIGVWLFYIQHQFEETYWRPHPEWDYAQASLQGSSFYKLPKILHWFTGNIGFHHIHHLSPKIPFYRLEDAYRENDMFKHSPTLTLASSLKCLNWRVWDEEQGKMVGFARASEVRRLQRAQLAGTD